LQKHSRSKTLKLVLKSADCLPERRERCDRNRVELETLLSKIGSSHGMVRQAQHRDVTYDPQGRGDARSQRRFTIGVGFVAIDGFDDTYGAVGAIGVRPRTDGA
jgi:hypothetical protein